MLPINASFDQLVKESVSGNPKHKRNKLNTQKILNLEKGLKSRYYIQWQPATKMLTPTERKQMLERLEMSMRGIF